jgi:hypothetical protein
MYRLFTDNLLYVLVVRLILSGEKADPMPIKDGKID